MKVDDLPRQHLAKELANLTFAGGLCRPSAAIPLMMHPRSNCSLLLPVLVRLITSIHQSPWPVLHQSLAKPWETAPLPPILPFHLTLIPRPFLHCITREPLLYECLHVLPVCSRTTPAATSCRPPFGTPPGRPLSAYRAFGFCLLGWRQPHAQQDIVEFADFVLPKLVPDHRCTEWQARRSEDGVLRCLDRGFLNNCLPPESNRGKPL